MTYDENGVYDYTEADIAWAKSITAEQNSGHWKDLVDVSLAIRLLKQIEREKRNE
jgi:hypothetical protein